MAKKKPKDLRVHAHRGNGPLLCGQTGRYSADVGQIGWITVTCPECLKHKPPAADARCPACKRLLRDLAGEMPLCVEVDGVWGCSDCYDDHRWPLEAALKRLDECVGALRQMERLFALHSVPTKVLVDEIGRRLDQVLAAERSEKARRGDR